MVTEQGRHLTGTVDETGRRTPRALDEAGRTASSTGRAVSGSGGALAGGIAAFVITALLSSAGGALAGGSGGITIVEPLILSGSGGAVGGGSSIIVGTNFITLSGSGGAVGGGAATLKPQPTFRTSGGAVVGDSSPSVATVARRSSGGAVAAGHSTEAITAIRSGSGGAVGGGYSGITPPDLSYTWTEPVAATYTRLNMTDVRIAARHDLITTALRVAYAWDAARNQMTRALLLEAPDAIAAYSRIESELRAGWLTSPRDAHRVGTAWLQRRARPIWQVTFTTDSRYRDLEPGSYIQVTHPLLPVSGRCLALEVSVDLERAEVEITTELFAGAVPRLTLANLATAYDPQTLQGVAVQFAAGQATLTILNEAGNPMAGAKVTLDNQQTRLTDKAGKVTFTNIARGQHLMKVEASGYAVQESVVTV